MERTRSIDADDLGWRFKSSRVGRGQFRISFSEYVYVFSRLFVVNLIKKRVVVNDVL